jgi:hypothetical protein
MNRSSLILGPDAQPAIITERPRIGANWQRVYEAADRRDYTGYFYLPTLDLGKALGRIDLGTLRERSVWTYANVGAIRMVIDGLAEEEVGGGLWPKFAAKAAPAYNEAATSLFHDQNHDARFFSANGRDSIYTAQIAIRRMIRLHGDCFAQFIRPQPGSTRPSLSLIPGWRIDNFGDEKPDSGWCQGIRTDALGRALEYRVIGHDAKGKRTKTDVPASEMLHLHDPLLPDQTRGEPILAAVAKRLFSREDILAAITNGTITRERMGFAIETAANSPFVQMGLPAGGDVTSTTDEGGTTQIAVQKIYGDDIRKTTDIPQLQPGQSVNVVESNRPASNVREFLDEILREVAFASKRPPEYVFFLAGLTQGTAVRLAMQRNHQCNESARTHCLAPFVSRWTVFDTWQRIKSGGFRGVDVPADWWRHEIIKPPNSTVDIGREGALLDHRLATGKMSPEEYHGLRGTDAETVMSAVIEDMQRKHEAVAAFNAKNGTNLSVWDLFPRSENQPIPQPIAD